MIRFTAMLGLGTLFLMISPKLREEVWNGMDASVKFMDGNAPISYVVFGIVVVFAFLFFVKQGSKLR